MEIRAFAEQILFATTLEEKLAPPSAPLSDNDPGQAIKAPGSPGRPASLSPKRGSGSLHLPAEAHLVNEDSRARLLHFFANHELLAVELMALVLLKFPDAPKAFRRGVVHTLKEEQCHTRWYIKRMGECGLAFGDLPVSRMIWDHIAPMESPLDYVSLLSLTFEQANLDYSLHYSKVMADAGDSKTAAILRQIHKDEIAHVGYGLAWFRRWKEARQSDWEAYRKQLSFPVSPARAKGGPIFNREGRLQAGLDPGFITRLELFSRSRSRTPDVFCFHPTCEMEFAAEAAGRPFQPNKAQTDLTHDLEGLMAWVASTDDLILLRSAPRKDHLLYLRRHGLLFPDWEMLPDPRPVTSLAERRLGRLRPWAWGPQAVEDLAPLHDQCSKKSIRTDPRLFCKTTVRAMLEPELEDSAFPLPPAHFVRRAEDLEPALDALAAMGYQQAVLKSDLGSAAQGNHRIPTADGAAPVRGWLARALRSGPLLLEPWLERAFEFSVHYERANDQSLRLVGFSRLHTNGRGQWIGSSAGPKFGRGLTTPIARFLMREVLPFYRDAFPCIMRKACSGLDHVGPVGVDAFIHRLADGGHALHAMVECNPRFTMGRIALGLRRHIAMGHFLTLTTVSADKASRDSLPVPFLDAAGKVTSGSLTLSDPQSARARVAVVHVAKSEWPDTEL